MIALATSHGFARGYAASGYGCSASVIAGEGAGMQRDYAYHSAHAISPTSRTPQTIGRRAGERAVARLNPGKLPSGTMPVVFDPRVGSSLLGHLVGAITGSAIARGPASCSMRGDERSSPASVTMRDDPHRPRGLRSKPFDGEGLPTAPTRHHRGRRARRLAAR